MAVAVRPRERQPQQRVHETEVAVAQLLPIVVDSLPAVPPVAGVATGSIEPALIRHTEVETTPQVARGVETSPLAARSVERMPVVTTPILADANLPRPVQVPLRRWKSRSRPGSSDREACAAPQATWTAPASVWAAGEIATRDSRATTIRKRWPSRSRSNGAERDGIEATGAATSQDGGRCDKTSPKNHSGELAYEFVLEPALAAGGDAHEHAIAAGTSRDAHTSLGIDGRPLHTNPVLDNARQNFAEPFEQQGFKVETSVDASEFTEGLAPTAPPAKAVFSACPVQALQGSQSLRAFETQNQVDDNADHEWIREGWMSKQSKHVGVWRRRWITLSTTALESFTEESSTKATETFQLRHIIGARRSIDTLGGSMIVVTLHDTRRELWLDAGTLLNATLWAEYINKAKERCHAQQICERLEAVDQQGDRTGRDFSFASRSGSQSLVLAAAETPAELETLFRARSRASNAAQRGASNPPLRSALSNSAKKNALKNLGQVLRSARDEASLEAAIERARHTGVEAGSIRAAVMQLAKLRKANAKKKLGQVGDAVSLEAAIVCARETGVDADCIREAVMQLAELRKIENVSGSPLPRPQSPTSAATSFVSTAGCSDDELSTSPSQSSWSHAWIDGRGRARSVSQGSRMARGTPRSLSQLSV